MSRFEAGGLADLLRERTRSLHRQAERSGVLRELLRGRADRRAYALLLRNLLPAYQRLEQGLEQHRARPGLAAVARPAVYRSAAIRSDLQALCGPDWSDRLPLLPSAARYARRVEAAAAGDGARLLAHAWTRYLGDLNGGRILSERLEHALGLGPDALAFYAYPEIEDLAAFRRDWRASLDEAGASCAPEPLVDEALAAFRHNIDVSEEVARAAALVAVGQEGGEELS